MFSRHVIKELSAYCNGELSADQSSRVRDHLATCERCRDEYEEIDLGARLAERLPQFAAPAGMWSEIEAALDQLAPKPVKRRLFGFGFGWPELALSSAALAAIIVIGLRWYNPNEPVGPGWEVAVSEGVVKVGRDSVKETGHLGVGEWLETGSSSRARVEVANIGYVEVDPDTRVGLVGTGPTEHRLDLQHGRLQARIYAPPRLFIVDTPSAVAIDLGCAYTLEVDREGRSFLHVTSGWVMLEREGRESYVPIGASCETRPPVGPGTPYFEDASDELREALAGFDFENGGRPALDVVLEESRDRDTFTLWHLLSRVEGADRVRVLNRMIELSPLPEGVTRQGLLSLDPEALELYKEGMDVIWF